MNNPRETSARPTSPILVRARSPSIWYRGEMSKRRFRTPCHLQPINHRTTQLDLIQLDKEDVVNMVAQGHGDEWVLANDKKSVRRWYSGEWRNNRLHGIGSILDEETGTTVFKGHFNMGKRTGFGKQFSPNKKSHVMFRGHFVNDKKEGEGAIFYDNGRLKYEGAMHENNFHGHGVMYHPTKEKHSQRIQMYVGQFQKNLKWGSGREYDIHGNLLYEGTFYMGTRHGYGKAYHCGQNHHQGTLSFVGRFENRLAAKFGMPHGGAGCLYLIDGRKFISSSFHDGRVDSFAESTMLYPDGKVVVGTFHPVDVTWITRTGIEPVETIWRGHGLITFADGSRYVGNFRNGTPHTPKGGLLTTKGLDQFYGKWTLGRCRPSVSSREVVRQGFALIFAFDSYPSHINNPPSPLLEADALQELLETYQFEVWREDNSRLQSVCQTFLEAQLH